VAALAGALLGSLATIAVGVINGRAEGRRERLRLATQLAIEEHKHLVEEGQKHANAGRNVGVAPISSMVAYHMALLERLKDGAELSPEEFIELRNRNLAIFTALAAESPRRPTAD
jgi:hypothetical protein